MTCSCSTGTHVQRSRRLGDESGAPFATLSEGELQEAAAILRRHGRLEETHRIAYIGLDEPDRREVLAGRPVARRALVQLLDVATGRAHDISVDLDRGDIARDEPIDPAVSGQVPLLKEEHILIRDLLATDERWLAALALRGIHDPATVALAGLSAGRFPIEGEDGRRMARVLGHHQPTPQTMPWAHPIDGLVAYVDLGARGVTQVIDTGVVPIPQETADYHVPGTFGPERTTQKPIVIRQPEGPSFSFDGDVVSWEKWSLRVGYDMREGLILHGIGFEDAGRVRPIVHRASIAEMLVPYGDPGPVRFWQNYFDTGEYLLGRLVNSLELGCDCVGDITYLDVPIADARGEVKVLPNAVCIHEEDAGVLWKHTEQFTGTTDVRRQRRLVISFFVTVGNYDYGFYWYLYLDGKIEFEAKATGLVFTAAYDERASRYASELAPGLAAPYHQHLFCARLDMAVDEGPAVVDEVDVTTVPIDGDNAHGTAIGFRATRLTSEKSARRRSDASVDRTWRVSSTTATNRLGRPVSYVLAGEGKPVLLAQPDSVIASRARFATADLWVTAYDVAERYPAGAVVNQSAGDQGLPAFVADDASLDGADLVLWHTFGLTHFPRTEDWPIMPVDTCGFVLRPHDFFDRNPTLDVPASVAPCSCTHEEHAHADVSHQHHENQHSARREH
ncbi:primary-amine oxidase [Microbacterium sp. CFH 90308]|uniref:Amine oxidase n=1 Tax=Microbacterium salsuginis TaxID=2722803 RepID=A0ABX1KB08_9MICO|nr:primary-amine oxidase [Microbacterium sp. CFH 90308]NLP84212.1 primary-amine oxidase [Microbacterium sp. CFH 90308]